MTPQSAAVALVSIAQVISACPRFVAVHRRTARSLELPGEDGRPIRQAEQALHAVELGKRIAAVEIRPSSVADEK